MTSSYTTTRRTVVKAGAWTAPAVLVAANTPVYAVSSPTEPTDLEVMVTDPPFSWETFEPEYSVPIYAGATGTRRIGNGALPPSFVVTNVGTTPATNPTGTFELQMRDVGTDAPSAGGADGTRANSTMPEVTITSDGKSQFGGGLYTWVYSGILAPGESVEIPLRYYVNYPFANVDYELFVFVNVIDEMAGDEEENDFDEKMGTVDGFARLY